MNNKAERVAMATLITIFFLLEKQGLDQRSGNISGPAIKKPIIKDELLKYHFPGALALLSIG